MKCLLWNNAFCCCVFFSFLILKSSKKVDIEQQSCQDPNMTENDHECNIPRDFLILCEKQYEIEMLL